MGSGPTIVGTGADLPYDAQPVSEAGPGAGFEHPAAQRDVRPGLHGVIPATAPDQRGDEAVLVEPVEPDEGDLVAVPVERGLPLVQAPAIHRDLRAAGQQRIEFVRKVLGRSRVHDEDATGLTRDGAD